MIYGQPKHFISGEKSLTLRLSLKCTASSQRRRCLYALISLNRLEPLQHLNLFRFRFTARLCADDFLCTGPVANQSLSFCLAVMHTNSQQHILISPESKAHQSQLTSPPGPARAILKKCFILSVRHMWIRADDFASYVRVFLLPPRRLCSGCNDFSAAGCVAAAIVLTQARPNLIWTKDQAPNVPRVTLITSHHQYVSYLSPETDFWRQVISH